ncbi:Oidioi.mRNA.OKI2018_I69.chr1.g1591.t1.cds [Oikopleura dioica]|uniref:Oidioi.mRNA.OKI2018_I69.chr1.g1591.t1.cds n=1 Tax=Oikopleura dioica TaxID=34765 RepID=A0ABN7SNE4_OIKDI|nr:Oidioi.mRNA.OKI2018_I69.chr1.g1591.t1.cds [Oikopleura dioica]
MQRKRFPGRDNDRERGRMNNPKYDSYDVTDFYQLENIKNELQGPTGDRRPAHWGNKYWDKAIRQSSKKVDKGRERKKNRHAHAIFLASDSG